MDGQVLAELIEQRHEALLDAWLERVLSRPGSHYRERPADQVRTWLADAVDAVLLSLRTRSEQPLEAHAAIMGPSRQRLGFRIDEVVDALLQLKEVLFAAMLEQWPERPRRRIEASRVLDRALRSLVSCFTADFALALREQEQQLSALNERQRLARDLHDAVSQSLYATHLHAGAAVRLLHADDLEGVDENLNLLRDAARQALADMRLLVFELRPSTLPDEGLVEALRSRLEAVESRSGIRTSFEADTELTLSAAVEEALFGVACEALNNSLKHAEAGTVAVSLEVEAHNVVLRVGDDGRGFEPGGAEHGFGLTGMHERVSGIGAELRLHSAPGSGTEVLVRVPLADAIGETNV